MACLRCILFESHTGCLRGTVQTHTLPMIGEGYVKKDVRIFLNFKRRKPMSYKNIALAISLACASTFSMASTDVIKPQPHQSAQSAPVKVVYHMSEGIAQASRGLNNIRNHLSADPSAKIVVVTHGLGIDFLLEGAVNQMDQPFAGQVADLVSKGVEFRVCNNTLVSRKLDPTKVIMEARVVPSGVAEVASLQAKEGFVYLRP